jgi:hypothetical protein
MTARQPHGLIPDPHGTGAADAAAIEAVVAQADLAEVLVAPADPAPVDPAVVVPAAPVADVSRVETANQPRIT